MDTLGALDWLFIAIILGTTLIGVFSGLIQQVASAIGLIGGIVLAQLFCEPMANVLNQWITNINLAKAISYLSIFISIGIAMRLFAALTTAIVETLALKTINRGAGAIFGFIKGFIITAIIAGTLHFYNSPLTESLVESSKICVYYTSFYQWLDNAIGDNKVKQASKIIRKKIGLELDEKD